MKILCIGEALIDMICTDTGLPLNEGSHFLKKAGGAPTNVAAAIASLGGEVVLAAKVGNDPFGRQLVNTMRGFGVSTEWMLMDKDHFTTFAFVSLLNDGERDFVFNRGADGQLSEGDIAGLDLNDYSIIHFGSATAFLEGPLQQAYKTLLEKARALNKFICFDPNFRHLLFPNDTTSFVEQSWNFLRHCNFFKVSDEEAMLLTATSSVGNASAAFAERTNAVFAITLGKEGTMLVFRGKKIMVPSIPVVSVDTTGAGDAFVGAVLYQLSRLSMPIIESMTDEDWRKVVLNANKAGARTCEYMGAMEAFSHLSSSIFE